MKKCQDYIDVLVYCPKGQESEGWHYIYVVVYIMLKDKKVKKDQHYIDVLVYSVKGQENVERPTLYRCISKHSM